MNEFELLQQAIANAQVGRSRLTDLAKGTYTLSVATDKKNPEKLILALVSEKKVRTPVTVNALASLRIATSKDKVSTIVSTEDARETEEISTFQAALAGEQVKLGSGLTFEVIHRLRVKDTVNDNFIMKNNCYKKYPEYLKRAGEISAMANVTEAEQATRNAAYNQASAELRAGGIKADMVGSTDDKHLSLIPVFTVK